MCLLGAEILNIHLQRARSEHDLEEAERSAVSLKMPDNSSCA